MTTAPAGSDDGLRCSRCGEPTATSELDRLLWCEPCIHEARTTATRAGWALGAGVAAVLAAWIWLVQKPSDLVVGGWIATVVAALWLGARVGKEVGYGLLRARHRPR